MNKADKDFKAANYKYVQRLKEIILKELKKGVVTVNHQIETIFKEIEMIKNQMQI